MTTRPVLLFACTGLDSAPWLAALSAELPDVELRVWPDVGAAGEVDYVLAWNAPAAVWAGLTGLKAVFSLGAGVDRLLDDPAVPTAPPLIRMRDPGLVIGMREYVLVRVLHHHRALDAYARAQADGRWRQTRPPLPGDRRVGVMGMGRLGGACSKSLADLGFDVSGWSRTSAQVEGVRSFVGAEELAAFAARAEILVCLLPLTPQTEGILARPLFDELPRGAHLINVARGAHLVEADLLNGLDSGRLDSATLDVFRTEPLPADHPFWRHPKVTVTPHISAMTQPKTASASLGADLRALERGDPVDGVVDRARGY